MKELSMEQKAKAYDEVRKKIALRFGSNVAEKIALRFGSNVAEEIFSEFEMSEDERIRKGIIRNLEYLADRAEGFVKDGLKERIAWLEKQGSEPNWCHHKVDLSNCSEEYRKAYYDGWNNCNQQHSQCKSEWNDVVPAWSEDDEERFQSCLNILQVQAKGFMGITETINTKWLKSLKDRVQPQPKQEWKQENREELTEFENAMMHIGGSFFGENAGLDPNDTATIREQAELLLELAPKTEWSEEDEKMKDLIISVLEVNHSKGIFKAGLRGIRTEEIVSWLKSIKNRIKGE